MGEKNIIKINNYESPFGMLVLGSTGDRLCMCDWLDGKNHGAVKARLERMLDARFEEGVSKTAARAAQELDEYFSGKRTAFTVPLEFVGTGFQKKVWNALLEIPFGSTVSYVETAHRIGMPRSVRAVANAVGANPVSVLAPCHRVIGNDGSLTGYAGGMEVKRKLLKLENVINQ